MAKMTIKSWAAEDRPREKLMMKGAQTLTTAELLAILINNGSGDQTAVDIAKEIMCHVQNNLRDLGNLSVMEMVNLKIKGLGKAKAVSIAAALELGIRRDSSIRKKQNVKQSSDVAAFLQSELGHKQMELFVVVYLNRANKIIRHEIISEGGITGTVADPRIILKKHSIIMPFPSSYVTIIPVEISSPARPMKCSPIRSNMPLHFSISP